MPDYDGLFEEHYYKRRHKYKVRTKLKYRKNHWSVLLAVTPYDIEIVNKLDAGIKKIK